MTIHTDVYWLAAASLFYALALYVAVLRIVRQHRAPSLIVNSLLTVGGLLHLGSFFVADNPIGILAHVLSILAFLTVLIYFIMQLRGRWGTLSIFILPAVLALCAFSIVLPHEMSGVGVTNILFALHVVVSLAGIGGIFTGFVYTVLFIIQDAALKRHRLGTLFQLIPSLSACERFAWRSLLGGWYLYTVGVVFGYAWSYISRDILWSLNPKQLGGTVAWAVFGLLVILHRYFHFRGKKKLPLYLLGFIFIIITFVGIKVG